MRIKNDKLKEYTEISAVKKLFELIKARKHIGVIALDLPPIEVLENVTGYDFKNTKDFCIRLEQFIEKHFYKGVDLRRARNGSDLERSDLAELLGVSVHTVKQMETNKKPLSEGAVDFIRVMGFQKMVPLKKSKKRAIESNGMHIPKNDKTLPKKKLQISQVTDQFKCHYCNQEKDDWELTTEFPNPYQSFYICEDCLLKQYAKSLNSRRKEHEPRKAA